MSNKPTLQDILNDIKTVNKLVQDIGVMVALLASADPKARIKFRDIKTEHNKTSPSLVGKAVNTQSISDRISSKLKAMKSTDGASPLKITIEEPKDSIDEPSQQVIDLVNDIF